MKGHCLLSSNRNGAKWVTVGGRHTEFQLRYDRAWIAGFLDNIWDLALRVLDEFQMLWFEKKPLAFGLPDAGGGMKAVRCDFLGAKRLGAGPVEIELSSLVCLVSTIRSGKRPTQNPSNR